jgi:hypothetical protein
MKQIEHTVTINYKWWRENGKKVKPAHVGALDETAMTRIAEMMNQGYVEGTLSDNIHMISLDPEEGVEYRGWWEVKNGER